VEGLIPERRYPLGHKDRAVKSATHLSIEEHPVIVVQGTHLPAFPLGSLANRNLILTSSMCTSDRLFRSRVLIPRNYYPEAQDRSLPFK
jgi:hypothetical protein